MKKLLLLAFLAVGMTAYAETFVTDDDKKKEQNESGVDLGKGKDDNDRWTLHAYVGVDVPTGAPDGVKFAPFRSWEINATLLQYDYRPKTSKTTLSAGLGFDWRTYTLKGHKDGFQKVGNVVSFNPIAGMAFEDFSSNIHTVSLSMPLLVKQRFSKDFAVTLGAQLNWNFAGRLHNNSELGDVETDEYINNIGQRPFTVDIMGIVHVRELGFYCKYSPMSVLKKDRGVEFQSLAFGLYF